MKAIVDNDFAAQVLASPKPVLVDFFTTWCVPCKSQVPILEKLAGEVGDKVVVLTMNLDESRNTAEKYRVLSVPTIILFAKGEVVRRWSGLTKLDVLKDAIAECP